MKLLILGSSGASGKIIIRLVLQSGLQVRAIVRSLGKLDLQHRNLDVVQRDILDEQAIILALQNFDAVVWAIGHENKSWAKKDMARDTCSRSAAYLLKVMKEEGINRLISISSWGVGEEN